jgi:hypothetical protein
VTQSDSFNFDADYRAVLKEFLCYFYGQNEEFECGECKVDTIVTSYLDG